jgi:hypothetical protein
MEQYVCIQVHSNTKSSHLPVNWPEDETDYRSRNIVSWSRTIRHSKTQNLSVLTGSWRKPEITYVVIRLIVFICDKVKTKINTILVILITHICLRWCAYMPYTLALGWSWSASRLVYIEKVLISSHVLSSLKIILYYSVKYCIFVQKDQWEMGT